jgi:hypothetical protein
LNLRVLFMLNSGVDDTRGSAGVQKDVLRGGAGRRILEKCWQAAGTVSRRQPL